MNVLSLFDGISCGQIALERTGIKVDKYFASEIDKYAIQVTQKNYPNTIQLGNVCDVKAENLPEIDLMLFGVPCQPYSISGKGLGLDDFRGKLIYEVFRLLKEIRPKYFLFENVKGLILGKNKAIFEFMLEEFCKCGYKLDFDIINSSKLSAQNRERIYVLGERIDLNELTNVSFKNKDIDFVKPLSTINKFKKELLNNNKIYTNYSTYIKQPDDLNIYLKDVLESGVVDRDKSYCIDANYFKGGNLKQYFEKSRRQLVFDKPERVGSIGKGGQGQRIYSTNGKSVTLSALGGGQGSKTGLYAVAQRGRNIVNGKRKDITGAKTKQRFETSFSNKSNCLTSVAKDSYILELNTENYVVRKLTPIECERLQTLPDNYTEGISNSQRYKALGNGWTINVISHILKEIK